MAARKDVQAILKQIQGNPRVRLSANKGHHKVYVDDRLVVTLSESNRRERTPGGDMTKAAKAVERAIRGEVR